MHHPRAEPWKQANGLFFRLAIIFGDCTSVMYLLGIQFSSPIKKPPQKTDIYGAPETPKGEVFLILCAQDDFLVCS